MKKKHLFNAALLWAFLSLTLWTTGCSDDDGYPDVDGQAPSIEMTLDTFRLQMVAHLHWKERLKMLMVFQPFNCNVPT